MECVFHDVAEDATLHGGQEEIFADDLNWFNDFALDMPNESVIEEVSKTRSEVHRWGKRYRVTFDPQKEHIVIVHPVRGEGEVFKLLGVLIDVKWNMEAAVDHCLARVRPKVNALLRTRGVYDLTNMLAQFKTHI